MKNPELYNKTRNILIHAYLNDHLEHKDYCGCAVGNLVAASMGDKVIYQKTLKDLDGKEFRIFYLESTRKIQWHNVFNTCIWNAIAEQKFYIDRFQGEAKLEIDSTGYELDQLMKIEYAFETATPGQSKEDFIFNGLTAALEVVDQIHEVEQNEMVEERQLI